MNKGAPIREIIPLLCGYQAVRWLGCDAKQRGNEDALTIFKGIEDHIRRELAELIADEWSYTPHQADIALDLNWVKIDPPLEPGKEKQEWT